MRRCLHCLNLFEPKKSNRTTYCSRQCSFADGQRVRLHVIRQIASRRQCRACFAQFFGAGRAACSESCAAQLNRQNARRMYFTERANEHRMCKCRRCGKTFSTRKHNQAKYCNGRCSRAAQRDGHDFRDRARKHGVRYEAFDKNKVFERDGWKCQLCGCGLLRKYVAFAKGQRPEPNSPTIDHVVPLSRGGPHTYENTQAACWACNTRKGDDELAPIFWGVEDWIAEHGQVAAPSTESAISVEEMVVLARKLSTPGGFTT